MMLLHLHVNLNVDDDDSTQLYCFNSSYHMTSHQIVK